MCQKIDLGPSPAVNLCPKVALHPPTLLLHPAAPPNTDAYAIVEVTQDCIGIQGKGSVTSRQLRV